MPYQPSSANELIMNKHTVAAVTVISDLQAYYYDCVAVNIYCNGIINVWQYPFHTVIISIS